MQKKVYIKTFGCQMNVYDSNRIYDYVKKIGYQKTNQPENTDCYILNTCHIRDKAKEKVFHEIGRVKKLFRNKKKPIMVIAGCVAQAENQEILSREPYVDFVIGPQSYHKINNVLEKVIDHKQEDLTEFDAISKFDELDKVKNRNKSISPFLTIQEGCDKFCNFCVVPFTRGPEYSRDYKKIIIEAEQLIENGAKEITLIGQNVNAYSFRKNGSEFRLSNIIEKLETYNELKRIRYTTSHPLDMTEDLINIYATSKKLMPFIHLPIQSGSNKILKLMNRKHTVEKYLDIIHKIKRINQKIKFSSDFIIGYPGENNENFQETLNLIKNVKFINSFSFIFSPRPGTKSSNMKLIDNDVTKSRLNEVQKVLFNFQKENNFRQIGEIISVLVENGIESQNKNFGRNEYLTPVIFDGKDDYIGKVVSIKVHGCNQNTLFGKVIDLTKVEAA